MTAPERGALGFVCFTAACIIGLSALEVCLHVADDRIHHRPLAVLPCLAWLVPLILGVVALVKARSIAGWISDKLDE